MDGGSSSCERFKLYDQLELHEFQDRFVVRSVELASRGFSINRGDGNIEPLNCKNFLFSFPSMNSGSRSSLVDEEIKY